MCNGCELIKHAKTTFPRSEHRSIGILDLIHSNVYALMSSTSLIYHIYYVIFNDDSFRNTWIYFMKTKDEVFNRFQVFKSLVEN
jgi:hypothetical protein